MTLAVIHEDGVGATQRDEDQVLIAVAVDVGKCAARGIPIRRRDTSSRRDILEPPVAQVAIQDVRAFGAGEKDVRASVPIYVRQTNAGSLRELAVLNQGGIADRVAKRDAGARRIERRETGCMCGRDRELAPTIPVGRMPGRVGGGPLRRAAGSRDERGERQNARAATLTEANKFPQSSGGDPSPASTRCADPDAP